MLESKELLHLLKATTLFAHVPDKVLTSIQDKMELFWLPSGTTLISQGEPGSIFQIEMDGVSVSDLLGRSLHDRPDA